MAAKSRKPRTLNQTQVVVTGTNLRMQAAKSSRQHEPNPVMDVVQDIHPVSGFVDFLREHAVVALAIGFVIGTQVQVLVKQLISSFIDPMFQLLFGQALSQRSFTLHWHGRASSFQWGAFVYGLLSFVFVIATIYAIVKIFKLDKLDKPVKKSK